MQLAGSSTHALLESARPRLSLTVRSQSKARRGKRQNVAVRASADGDEAVAGRRAILAAAIALSLSSASVAIADSRAPDPIAVFFTLSSCFWACCSCTSHYSANIRMFGILACFCMWVAARLTVRRCAWRSFATFYFYSFQTARHTSDP
jgi:hypothetical protein